MATSSTREGSAAMSEEQNRQSLVSKPLGWISTAGSKLLGLISTVRQFWHEIALEMKKVSWPTRNEVINTTIITIVVVFFFAAFLWVADIVLSWLIQGIEWVANWIFG